MDRKTLIIAIVAGLAILGGVGYSAMKGGVSKPAETPTYPAPANELPTPPTGAQDGQAHSKE